MSRIAIIPAREGSKRIPGKNIRPFLGKPAITYAIDAALSSELFDEVMVSTDSPQIAKLASELGASVPFLRSDDNADDYATTMDVIQEVIDEYNKQGKSFDEACCIYATAVFTTANHLKAGLDVLQEGDFDSVLPAIAFNPPVQRGFGSDENGRMVLREPEFKHSRSQDLQKVYHDAGQFYWMKIKAVIESKSLWTANTGIIEIDESECHDIDTEFDWQMAEMKYKLLEKR